MLFLFYKLGSETACFFQQQDVLKQVMVSSFYLCIATAILQYEYLRCAMNDTGEPIQARNNCQKKKVIMLEMPLSAKETLAKLYIHLR